MSSQGKIAPKIVAARKSKRLSRFFRDIDAQLADYFMAYSTFQR